MTRLLSAAAALAVVAFAAPAFAASMSAQLQSPVAAPAKIVAGGAVWRCEGSVCSTADSDRAEGLDACRALARAIGPVAGYGGFDAARLAKCDAGLSTSATLAQAGAPAQPARR